MNKSEMIRFFDMRAPSWDACEVRKDDVIDRIFDNAHICGGLDILDVACGTGVLFPHYIKRNVRSVTAIDISGGMAKIAAQKAAALPDVSVICADVEEYSFDRMFDSAMVYNAFPHFFEPEHLISVLFSLIRPGGRLTVAHSMSREEINRLHLGAASSVSEPLPPAEELKKLMDVLFDVDTVISDDEMYEVSGIKRR